MQFQYISQLAVLVGFILNQQVIVKIWCEKRNEENNTCNGKCYLKKQLKKTEAPSESQQSKFPAYKFKFDVEYAVLSAADNNFFYFSGITHSAQFKSLNLSRGYLSVIAKPPIA
jgi:hypothetical protein